MCGYGRPVSALTSNNTRYLYYLRSVGLRLGKCLWISGLESCCLKTLSNYFSEKMYHHNIDGATYRARKPLRFWSSLSESAAVPSKILLRPKVVCVLRFLFVNRHPFPTDIRLSVILLESKRFVFPALHSARLLLLCDYRGGRNENIFIQ